MHQLERDPIILACLGRQGYRIFVTNIDVHKSDTLLLPATGRRAQGFRVLGIVVN